MSPTLRAVARFFAGIVASVQLAGCTATPVPEPPSASGDGVGKPIDVGLGAPVDSFDCPIFAPFTGHAKPGLTVWGLRLDLTTFSHCDPIDESPVEVTVPDSGDFVIQIWSLAGNEIRLQLRDGDRRGDPVDYVAGSEVGPLAAASRQECLTVDLELDMGDVAVAQTGSGSA
jgi:hypothetical protein